MSCHVMSYHAMPYHLLLGQSIPTPGFDDALKLLERLSLYVFDLPVDLAVQQFQELDEAF